MKNFFLGALLLLAAYYVYNVDRNRSNGLGYILQGIGFYGYRLYDDLDLAIMYINLLASAVFPIWIGSHASLCKPPGDICTEVDLTEDDTKDRDSKDSKKTKHKAGLEGLTPTDALVMPIMAAMTLGGLYFLIKWLEDPAIINKILNYYFSVIGVFGTGRLMADALNLLTSFVFPSFWTSTKDDKAYCTDMALYKAERGDTESVNIPESNFVSISTEDMIATNSIHNRLPRVLNKFSWYLRSLMTGSYPFKAYHYQFGSLQKHIRLNDIVGLSIGLLSVVTYNYYAKLWWLTNLTAFGLCYGTLQLLSPTTFWTGTMVLGGLFIYDIIMVFYTPLMVTVATSLDVPIKLVFPGSSTRRGSMLGLGDVVLPGIMIALALRFDLYMKYRKIVDDARQDPKYTPDFKCRYYQATGYQGERFWTSPSVKHSPKIIHGGNFPKPYFYASIVGYVAGMLTTLYVMNIWKHAQPALLYLVPGVLGALWGTAFVRGEIKYMWNYCEEFGGGDEGESKITVKTGAGVGGSEKKMSMVQEMETRDDEERESLETRLFSISLDRPRRRQVKCLKLDSE